MKLCIPVSGNDGLASEIESHLPAAQHLLFFDTETRQHVHVSLREPGQGDDKQIRMDAVLCGSIDHGTLRHLIGHGIEVYGTDARTVAHAVAQFENGELAPPPCRPVVVVVAAATVTITARTMLMERVSQAADTDVAGAEAGVVAVGVAGEDMNMSTSTHMSIVPVAAAAVMPRQAIIPAWTPAARYSGWLCAARTGKPSPNTPASAESSGFMKSDKGRSLAEPCSSCRSNNRFMKRRRGRRIRSTASTCLSAGAWAAGSSRVCCNGVFKAL